MCPHSSMDRTGFPKLDAIVAQHHIETELNQIFMVKPAKT